MSAIRPFEVPKDLYPFEDRWFVRDGTAMHYIDCGSGPPVVFFHGSPTWSFLYRDVIVELDGVRALSADMIGFGMSDQPEDFSYAPEEQAEWLGAWIDSLDLPPFVAVVQDWGGPVGLRVVAERAERLAGLVIMNTWCWPPSRTLRILSWLLGGPLGAMLLKRSPDLLVRKGLVAEADKSPEVFAAYAAPIAANRQGPMTLQRAIRKVDGWLLETERMLDRLANLPVELVWGLQDKGLGGEEVLARWLEHFPAAGGTRLPHASHFLQEDDPTAIADAIRRVLVRTSSDSTDSTLGVTP